MAIGAALGIAAFALLQQPDRNPAPPTTPAASVRGTPEPAIPAAPSDPVPPPAAPTPAAAPAAAAVGSDPVVATTASIGKAVAPASRDLLETRLAATRDWLEQHEQNAYSIQVSGTSDAEQLNKHLNDIAKSVEMNKLYVYPTLARQKPYWTVLYGSFSNRRAAQDALAKLPPALMANQPLLRTVQGIRSEIKIKRHQPPS